MLFQLLALTENWFSQRTAIMKETLLKKKFFTFHLQLNPLHFGVSTHCTSRPYFVKVIDESLVTKSSSHLNFFFFSFCFGLVFLMWLAYSIWKCWLFSPNLVIFEIQFLVLHNSSCHSSSYLVYFMYSLLWAISVSATGYYVRSLIWLFTKLTWQALIFRVF